MAIGLHELNWIELNYINYTDNPKALVPRIKAEKFSSTK